MMHAGALCQPAGGHPLFFWRAGIHPVPLRTQRLPPQVTIRLFEKFRSPLHPQPTNPHTFQFT